MSTVSVKAGIEIKTVDGDTQAANSSGEQNADQSGGQPATAEKGIAILIGIGQYSDRLPDLKCSHSDVDYFGPMLRSTGQYDRVITITSEKGGVTMAALVEKLRSALLEAERGDYTRLMVYFSGHGARDDRGNQYLVVSDTIAEQMGITAIRTTQILDRMDACDACREKYLVLDCASAYLPQVERQWPEIALLAASSADGTAFEDDQTPLSVFTLMLGQGLSGKADLDEDGRVNYRELETYVTFRTSERVRRRFPNRRQTPVFSPREDNPVMSRRGALRTK